MIDKFEAVRIVGVDELNAISDGTIVATIRSHSEDASLTINFDTDLSNEDLIAVVEEARRLLQ
jgi:hypothetical protein